ncbi:MAG: hypothetical protein LDL07_06240 [Desulfarculus sp.]|nr:hypothetical protein [Desulfarculus sp.]
MAWSVIQRWVRRQGRDVSLSEIAQAMKLGHADALRRVRRLVEGGQLIDHGGDRISVPPRPWDKPRESAPPAQVRIWQAVNYRDMKGGAWTAVEIARVAEASLDYTRDYLRHLESRGLVSVNRRPGQATRYRLHPDAPPIGQPPVWTNRRNRELRQRRAQPP